MLRFARRLVAVLSPVVQPGCSFDEHVFYVRELRDLGFCRRIAAQQISDDPARHGFVAKDRGAYENDIESTAFVANE